MINYAVELSVTWVLSWANIILLKAMGIRKFSLTKIWPKLYNRKMLLCFKLWKKYCKFLYLSPLSMIAKLYNKPMLREIILLSLCYFHKKIRKNKKQILCSKYLVHYRAFLISTRTWKSRLRKNVCNL